jgi:micrococcal nuclease
MDDHRKARRWRAFSFCGIPVPILLLVSGFALASGQAPDCGPDSIDERALVERVHDGDGRSVRLIGINAPELARRDGSSPAEAHAELARAALRKLLPPGSAVDLDFEAQREDRYGRLLAHVHLVRGEQRNVQQILLEQGHAFAAMVPPNLARAECYRHSERLARERRAGLWALAVYDPVDASRLERGVSGFRLIRGRVERVAETRGAWWIELEGDVSLRIPKADMHQFQGYPLTSLAGQVIEARGWLVPRRGSRPGSIMNLHHPAALEVVATGSGDSYRPDGAFAEPGTIPDN